MFFTSIGFKILSWIRYFINKPKQKYTEPQTTVLTTIIEETEPYDYDYNKY
jgi:hypothetical protein